MAEKIKAARGCVLKLARERVRRKIQKYDKKKEEDRNIKQTLFTKRLDFSRQILKFHRSNSPVQIHVFGSPRPPGVSSVITNVSISFSLVTLIAHTMSNSLIASSARKSTKAAGNDKNSHSFRLYDSPTIFPPESK